MNSYIERFSVGLPQLGVLVHKESEPFDFYLIPADTQVLKDHVLGKEKGTQLNNRSPCERIAAE